MHAALWIAKTGLDAQHFRISTIANNLANVNTDGFKHSRAVFEDLLYQNLRQVGAQSSQDYQLPSGLMCGTGVRPVATVTMHIQGALVKTEEASLDMAINGRGFFQILMPDGTIGYTRAGAFQLNSEGEIVTPNGYPLEPSIIIPPNIQSVTIGEDGTISVLEAGQATPVEIGAVEIADFVNPGGLQPIGGNLFLESAASGTSQTAPPGSEGFGRLIQGYLETSNVNASEELVNMIEAERAYEMNSKCLKTADNMLQYLSNNL
ncbi:MAG: flagellar basal-body rod protein FlgG [Thermodesulfobacteriota bacterium]|nr:flagellar basal-body rod protein FlgG [Thermodesulfobacteriota bacterium]